MAFLGGPPGLLSTIGRHAGFAQTVAAAGAQIVFESYGDYSAAEGRHAALQLAEAPRPGDGGLCRQRRDRTGRAGSGSGGPASPCPRMLSIIAFDDVGPLHLLQPPLTAIRQPVADMARQGVALLVARIQGGPVPDPVLLPVQLVAARFGRPTAA